MDAVFKKNLFTVTLAESEKKCAQKAVRFPGNGDAAEANLRSRPDSYRGVMSQISHLLTTFVSCLRYGRPMHYR
jgi:hypothetical protein